MRDEQRKALKLEHKNLSDIKFSNCRRWRQKSSSSASPRLNENSNNNANDMKRETNKKIRNGRMSDPMDVGAFSGVLNVCVFCCSAGWLSVCLYARPPAHLAICLFMNSSPFATYSQRKNFQLLMIFHRWPNIEFFSSCVFVCVCFSFFCVFCLLFGWGSLLLLWLLLLGIQFGWLKIN